MRRTYRRKKYKPDKTVFKANLHIRVPEVRVIDDKGNMLGVMTTKEALMKAQEGGMDLVEVNPKAVPPIVKFLDFGKFQYEQEKQKQKQKLKAKKVDVKGIRLTFRIGDHDREVRLNQANGFFEKGHKVKVELILRGREHAFTKDAVGMVQQFITDLRATITEGELIIETPPKKEGNAITALLGVKKAA
jgi:translation initiation factor IF-3